jgi:esterase/lipase
VPYLKKSVGSDIRDPAARERHPSYPVMPLASVHQLMHLQRRVEAALAQIRAPILVAHGHHDSTANPADARLIHDRVSSRERSLLLVPDSGHVVPVDHGGERLAGAVVEHLLRFA